MTNTSNLPVEALEREYPLLVERYQFRTDSGGPARYRGGLGIQRDIRVLHEGVTFSGLADRQRLAPWGLHGGQAGAAGRFVLQRRGAREEEVLSSKVSNVALAQEDMISVRTPGAGGFGPPRERDPRAVLKDVIEGKISRRAASDEYGVVVNDNGEIDADNYASQSKRDRTEWPVLA